MKIKLFKEQLLLIFKINSDSRSCTKKIVLLIDIFINNNIEIVTYYKLKEKRLFYESKQETRSNKNCSLIKKNSHREFECGIGVNSQEICYCTSFFTFSYT